MLFDTTIVNKKKLFESGAYVGGLVGDRNPSMDKYVVNEYNSAKKKNKIKSKNGIVFIDLNKTINSCRKLGDYLKKLLLTDNDKILFFSTKVQTREFVKEQALACNMPYIVDKWKGGLLTNFDTIKKKIKRLKVVSNLLGNEEKRSKLEKKEKILLEKELRKLQSIYGGISSLEDKPVAIFFFGGKFSSSMSEARKSGVKIISLCKNDSNASFVDFVIPANNEKVKSINFFASFVSNLIKNISTK